VEESLTQFAIRRLGRQGFERIVQPLVGGIYTADPDKLSVAATMPRFVDMEREHGSLTRGIKKSSQKKAAEHSGARYSMFVAPKDGMSSLVAALAARLPAGCVQLESPVEHIQRLDDGRWRLRHARGEYRQSQVHDYDAIILASPVRHTARLLESVDAEIAGKLASIESASSAVVTFGYRRDRIGHPLDGFGFVVPAIERRRILAGSFASNKFPGRAPDGCVSIRVFLGGALQSELLDRDDAELVRIAREELGDLIGAEGDPMFGTVTRWPDAMPQYHVGHGSLIQSVRQRVSELPGLELAGNVFSGVGVPNCIDSGEKAAEATIDSFHT
ncbi:MAG: protoporphyrinogen oxidase, partial [Pirellulales bacterium]|nr:protoporphyrinogen oxidase [Pirellulales bacterium]